MPNESVGVARTAIAEGSRRVAQVICFARMFSARLSVVARNLRCRCACSRLQSEFTKCVAESGAGRTSGRSAARDLTQFDPGLSEEDRVSEINPGIKGSGCEGGRNVWRPEKRRKDAACFIGIEGNEGDAY